MLKDFHFSTYVARNMLVLCCVVAFYSQFSAAQVYFEETFFPVYVNKNDAASVAGGSNSKSVPIESGLGFDTNTTLAYVWQSVIMGFTYNNYKVNTSRSLTADYEGLTASVGRQEYGPTVGYILGSWKMMFTYFIKGTKETAQRYTAVGTGAVSVDETYKNDAGNGFQLGVAYTFGLGAGFGISPTLIYRSMTYSKQSYTVRTGTGIPYAMGPLQTKAIDSDLKPMISITYMY